MAGAGAGATHPLRWLHDTSGGGATNDETSFHMNMTIHETNHDETSDVAGAGAGATHPLRWLHDTSGGGAMNDEMTNDEMESDSTRRKSTRPT